MSPKSYRALIKRAAGPSGGTLLHLIPEDAEASLCGIPRASLTTSGLFDELVCEDCLEWLRKGWEEEREVTSVTIVPASGHFPPGAVVDVERREPGT